MYTTAVVVAALCGLVSSHYYPTVWQAPLVSNPAPWRAPVAGPVPRCVLGDQVRYLPMYVVPERQLNILQDYRTRFFTPAPALVSFIGQQQSLPAVRVILSNPIPVTSWKTFIEFPTSFEILQDGYRLPFHVAALYAPLPEREILRRPVIDVVYAVPAGPQSPPLTPALPIVPAPLPPTPAHNVTVLHFPDALAQPQVLYQEVDDELGGRNPPLPVVPAGIVQSAAPTPDITVFINSKESPVLQLLRDEANRQKNFLRNQY